MRRYAETPTSPVGMAFAIRALLSAKALAVPLGRIQGSSPFRKRPALEEQDCPQCRMPRAWAAAIGVAVPAPNATSWKLAECSVVIKPAARRNIDP